ncbi:MAG: phosphoribosylanthranilate isomerase [Chloroflexi bacterium]|nr:phosphoribosylanthranilate isomerase [Chloroflexota bacterium]
MHIKICGLTNLDDACLSLEAGADLLGFNFYRPSPRFIAPEVAAAIITTLRQALPHLPFRGVGVFVNEPLDSVRRIQEHCALDLIQLHGDESVAHSRALGTATYKALRSSSHSELELQIADWFAATIGESREPIFLLDAAHPLLYGGTGQQADWSLAQTVAVRYPILLAGGLTPANVADAIAAVRPWGVDVASGVERRPGQKDPEKVKQFIQAAKCEKR